MDTHTHTDTEADTDKHTPKKALKNINEEDSLTHSAAIKKWTQNRQLRAFDKMNK